jgi:hypothetical protein
MKKWIGMLLLFVGIGAAMAQNGMPMPVAICLTP